MTNLLQKTWMVICWIITIAIVSAVLYGALTAPKSDNDPEDQYRASSIGE